MGARGRNAGHVRADRRTPGRRGHDGERRGAADIRAGRAARAYLESAARQSGPGHLCPAGPGLRPAPGPARLGRGPAGRRPGRAGGGAAAAWADAEGASGNRMRSADRLVTEVVDARCGTRRDARGHRDGAPGGSAGAGRAPRMAVRTARRGRRRDGFADRGRRELFAGSCRSPRRAGRRGRHPGPGARRPGPGERGDRRAGREIARPHPAGRRAGTAAGAGAGRDDRGDGDPLVRESGRRGSTTGTWCTT